MPAPAPVPTSGAVFLSYAREDAAAACRIADALRAFGVEVWFDQHELRGGDTWDAKIKKQIRECALFVPLVSAHTQGRAEGYFRREWLLGVERTRDMAGGVAFVVPVAIDETREADAIVPEEFMRVQWTRLRGALPTTEFVEQIVRLLALPRTPSPPGRKGGQVSELPRGEMRAARRRTKLWLAVAAAVAIAAAAFFATRKFTPAAESPKSVADARSAPAVSDKSIAVLPFANLSDDKDSGFFADGVQEDILTNLALVRELRVVSRTSVGQYRDTKKTVRQIGRELAVAYVLEGSVRRAAGKVRVSAQLIRTAADEHVWAKTYNSEVKELFDLQSALAREIADALHAVLTPQEQKLLARRPTENTAAYELYLKARRIRDSANNTRAMVEQQLALLEAAVVLDSRFALAWGDLGWCHSWMWWFGNDRSTGRLTRAKHAIATTVRLAPDQPETILNVGYFYNWAEGDFNRAAAEFEKILAAHPNNLPARFALSFPQNSSGKIREALANRLFVAQQDPANGDYAAMAANLTFAARRFDEAIFYRRRLAYLNPKDVWVRLDIAQLEFFRRGSTAEMDDFFARLSPEHQGSAKGLSRQINWALMCGRLNDAIQLDRGHAWKQEELDIGAAWAADAGQAIGLGTALAALGDRAKVAARLRETHDVVRARLAAEPTDATAHAFLAMIEALLGNTEAARRNADQLVKLPGGTLARFAAPFAYAWSGYKDAAIARYAELLQQPSYLNIHVMRHDPAYHPLRGDPRFEALLNDPKNNAPLF